MKIRLAAGVVHRGATAIYTFFFTAAGITVLSKFYRHIVGGETGEGGPAAVGSA